MSSGSTFDHALVAVDGSARSDAAVRLALRPGLAERVSALMVVRDYGVLELAGATFGPGPGPGQLHERILEEGRCLLDRTLDASLPPGAGVARCVVIGDEPWQEIIEVARREGCDLIVMASRGRGEIASAVLGSQTSRVLSESGVPVLVAR